ncbi:MAG: DNA repair protein RadC [Planctomycetota bacterium]
MSRARTGSPAGAVRDSVAELPREKILAAGAAALTDIELLAVLLGTGSPPLDVFGVSGRLLEEFGDSRRLAGAHPQEVLKVRGLGAAKVARIFAALELGSRLSRQRWERGESFTSSRQVFQHLHESLRNEKREFFIALLLDARNRLIGEQVISTGSLVASIVHPREVFRPAIRLAAASVICVHNHPSGDPMQSADDVEVTCRLQRAGEILGIQLLDHIIIGDGAYVSFLDSQVPPFHAGAASAARR